MASSSCPFGGIIDENINVTVPTLRFLSLRSVSLSIFESNQGRHAVRNAARYIRDYIRYMPVPRPMREVLKDGILQSFKEVHRWWEKHAELFQDKQKNRRSEHLSLYFHCIQWNTTDVYIADYTTALRLMEECSDWPQLQFQIACAYALEDHLLKTDKIRIRVFKQRLSDHPMFDFWFLKLEDKKDLLWTSNGLSPSQPVSLAFQWALNFGYQELAKYIWDRVTPPQQEYIGLLQWRQICMQAKNRPTFKFLCRELCIVNAIAVQRVTYHIFYHALHKIITETKIPTAVKELNVARIKFLLYHGCETLRMGLLRAQDYRCIQLALQYNDSRIFSLLQSQLNDEQLQEARHHFEATECLRPQEMAPVRVALAQRQWSIG